MRRFVAANPVLTTGLLGTLLFGVWLALGLQPRDGGLGQATFYLWRVLAAPVHLASNALAPLTNDWPDALAGGASRRAAAWLSVPPPAAGSSPAIDPARSPSRERS